MADGSVNFTNDSEYVVFSTNGKTMIGRFYKDTPSLPTGGVHLTLMPTDVYYVANPAEVVFELKVPEKDDGGSAELKWKLNPLYYPDLVATDTGSKEVLFSFPKSTVALSAIGGTLIDSTLLSAYQEISGK